MLELLAISQKLYSYNRIFMQKARILILLQFKMSVVKGKVIVVTGGANGIGLAYVEELLANGVKVNKIR